MHLFTIQQRYKYYFSCCISCLYICVFFLVRIYPSVLFSVCASFRVRFIPMRLYTYAFFSGALFSYVLFSSALFSGHPFHHMLTLLKNFEKRVLKSLIRIVQKPYKPTLNSPGEVGKRETTGHCSPEIQRGSVHSRYPPVLAVPTSHKSESATMWPLWTESLKYWALRWKTSSPSALTPTIVSSEIRGVIYVMEASAGSRWGFLSR